MNDNLFSFPGESTGQTGDDIFGSDGFTDLGSADVGDNPFADMEAAAAAAPEAPAGEPPASAPAPQQAPTQVPQPQAAQQTQPAPQASPNPGSQPQTSAAPEAAEEPNPLLAAMDLQDQSNARKAAAPVFAQLPVFSYNGNEDPIENTEQTFEELRLAKADDFPEFDEAQSISWSVTYGKISKSVEKPRKTKIGDFKREIESSKEFMEALKKSKDKRPKCIVKPVVKMQKKGECAYKGIFPRLADARESDKTICFIPAQDGLVYERRVTGAGEFITPTSGVTYLDEIKAGFTPALPLIPYALMAQAVSLFRLLMGEGKDSHPLEALVHIYWDREEERFFLNVAERYSNVFGLETSYVPDFIESAEKLEELVAQREWKTDRRVYDEKQGCYVPEYIPEIVILIGAVDNNRSRQLCHEVFLKARELVYIDSGNGEYTGQVVCGIRRNGKTIYKPVGTLYPDMAQPDDLFPSEVSCAEASVSAPQTIVANLMAATAVVTMIYNILVVGSSTVQQATFSTKTVNIRAYQKKKKGRKAA